MATRIDRQFLVTSDAVTGKWINPRVWDTITRGSTHIFRGCGPPSNTMWPWPRIHEAIVGTTVAPMIASCIHPIMVMSTCQGSIPFAPFAGGSDTLVAASVVTTCISSCTAAWCGVCGLGKYLWPPEILVKLVPADSFNAPAGQSD